MPKRRLILNLTACCCWLGVVLVTSPAGAAAKKDAIVRRSAISVERASPAPAPPAVQCGGPIRRDQPVSAKKAKGAASKQGPADRRSAREATPRVIQPTRPEAELRSGSLRKAGPPPVAGRDPRREMRQRPIIQSVRFDAADGGSFTMGSGVLAPRGRLRLTGRGFGANKGVALLDGLPGGYVVLENVQWSDTEVHGTIPSQMKGALFVRYPVTVQILLDELVDLSSGYPLEFEHPTEIQTLSGISTAVSPHCDNDANGNQCNAHKKAGDSCVVSGGGLIPPPSGTAIYGFHGNCSGAIGDDKGTDHYDIKLLNGWRIHEIVEIESTGSSSDEWASTPSLGTGQSKARVSVSWLATPGDHVRYWYKIKVAGPLGTSYHNGAQFGGSGGRPAIGRSHRPNDPDDDDDTPSAVSPRH